MKYLFTLLSSIFFLVSGAQDIPETKEENKAIEEVEIFDRIDVSDSNLEGLNGISINYQQFNSRKQDLLNNGVNTTILKNDGALNGFLSNVANIDPNTHEFNMMQYWLNGKDLNAEKYLLDAYRLDPNNEESFDEVLEYANWTSNRDLELELAQKIKTSSKYEKAIYDYSEDLLKSLPDGSVLITSGEIETITGRVLQLVEGKSKGIVILRKEWIESKRYSPERLQELGLKLNTVYGDLKPAIQNIIESNPNKNFYLSLTLPKSEFSYISDKLFLTGLAYQYSSATINNLNQIQSNWENVYLDKKIDQSELGYFGKKLMSNYLLSGIKLYQFYEANGEKKKAKKLKDKIFEMAELSGHIDKVKLLL